MAKVAAKRHKEWKWLDESCSESKILRNGFQIAEVSVNNLLAEIIDFLLFGP